MYIVLCDFMCTDRVPDDGADDRCHHEQQEQRDDSKEGEEQHWADASTAA
jgi:hypothetical protein